MERPVIPSNNNCLFDTLRWRDPISGLPLEPIITARTPSGVPISGAMRIQGTNSGYPIVDCIVRLTPELAEEYKDWLRKYSLEPPAKRREEGIFQKAATVDSFGWQWTWNSMMRSEADLRMRVIDKFNVEPTLFANRLVLDAGAGAGDQSKFMMSLGAAVVSVDLSSAIEVVARKLRMNSEWVGLQADIMNLPFVGEQFDIVYCEGVIQHTQDSVKTVKELCRVLKAEGLLLAAHYVRQPVNTILGKIKRRITSGYYEFLRNRLSHMERFRLLLVTGILAAFNYTPLVGYLLRKTGSVLYYDLMPDFKTTWTNTFDYYGNHSYQRFVTPEEFYGYFEDAGGMELVYKKTGNVVAKKLSERSAR
jgi:ubiquinone/menaquinone biosynthesis C-methylase UbiE